MTKILLGTALAAGFAALPLSSASAAYPCNPITGVFGAAATVAGAAVTIGTAPLVILSGNQPRFVDYTLHGDGERLYRSGDIVRYLADGNLVFLGRLDHQVKIRGYRIELGEIEAALVEHPEVSQAIVVAREDEPGDKRLVAYVVATDEVAIDAGALRVHLKRSLPEYMVPSAYVMLQALPFSPSGKVDRRALPAPEEDAVVRGEYVAPRT